MKYLYRPQSTSSNKIHGRTHLCDCSMAVRASILGGIAAHQLGAAFGSRWQAQLLPSAAEGSNREHRVRHATLQNVDRPMSTREEGSLKSGARPHADSVASRLELYSGSPCVNTSVQIRTLILISHLLDDSEKPETFLGVTTRHARYRR